MKFELSKSFKIAAAGAGIIGLIGAIVAMKTLQRKFKQSYQNWGQSDSERINIKLNKVVNDLPETIGLADLYYSLSQLSYFKDDNQKDAAYIFSMHLNQKMVDLGLIEFMNYETSKCGEIKIYPPMSAEKQRQVHDVILSSEPISRYTCSEIIYCAIEKCFEHLRAQDIRNLQSNRLEESSSDAYLWTVQETIQVLGEIRDTLQSELSEEIKLQYAEDFIFSKNFILSRNTESSEPGENSVHPLTDDVFVLENSA